MAVRKLLCFCLLSFFLKDAMAENRTISGQELPSSKQQKIQMFAVIFLFLSLLYLSSYIHVLRYTIKALLHKKFSFFLQLIFLGFHENLMLVIYCYYLFCSIVLIPEAFPFILSLLTALVWTFLMFVCRWMFLVIGCTRALFIFYPIKARVWFMKSWLNWAFLGSAWVYSLIGIFSVFNVWPTYIPTEFSFASLQDPREVQG